MIRDATEQDLPAIRDIYNDAVLNTTAIWNEQPVDLANRQAWFAARQTQGYPILVAVENDEVTGYASFGDWRPFEGFRYSVCLLYTSPSPRDKRQSRMPSSA